LVRYLEIVGLTFGMADAAVTEAALVEAGFTDVSIVDRNAWYQAEVIAETARLEAPEGYAALVEAMGESEARIRVESNRARREAVAAGSLRPTHFRARRP